MPLRATAFRPLLALFGALSLALANPVWSQEEIPSSVQIEVLVFEYVNGGAGSEAGRRLDEGGYRDLYVLSEPPGDGWFRVIPASKQRLAGASGVLSRSSRTRLLLHTGWQQPSRDSRRIVLRSDGEVQVSDSDRGLLQGNLPVADGWLELQSGRGLRVQLSFDHRREGGDGFAEYRMDQTRVLTPGEIHYFDHPAFGVLVRVDAIDQVL